MAVRIALQCSEADAHLILSEENSAARLLSRPGEAIYNDANGLVHGNHPFQIVWLSDERREQYLQALQQLSAGTSGGENNRRRRRRSCSKATCRPTFAAIARSSICCGRPIGRCNRRRSTPGSARRLRSKIPRPRCFVRKAATISCRRSARRKRDGHVRLRDGEPGGAASADDVAGLSAPPALPPEVRAQFYVLEHDRPADLPLDRPLADLPRRPGGVFQRSCRTPFTRPAAANLPAC